MKTKKIVSLLLCLVLLAAGTVAFAAESVYPIPGDLTLTYFGQLHKKVAKVYPGWEALDVVNDWFETTGVSLEFQCPPAGMEEEQFNLMLASGEYTDIIVYNMVQLEGGLTKLYEDGVIVDLTDYLEQYAPNYWKYLNDNPDIKKEVMDDNGRIFCFVFAKGGGYLLSTTGPIVREDVLAELNLEAPQTIDEWEAVLTAVKEAGLVPYTGTLDDLLSTFSPAYELGMKGDWYMDDAGQVHYVALEEGFKEFLTRMKAWYDAGLLDKDIVSLDDATADNKMSAGLAFSTFGAGSNQIASYMSANAGNETYSVSGVKVPTIVAGDKAKYVTEYSATANAQCAISTSCKNVIEAIQMYDWGYSEEGSRRLNWGIEGESYTVDENGVPHYTDLILNNPEGLSVDGALANYALVAVKGPAMMVQDPQYMMDYYALDQQKRSMESWADKDLDSHQFPNVSYTEEESKTVTGAMADITTYVDSMMIKFIVGTESLENFDNFVNTIKGMGIENALAAQQAAADRYNAR